MKVVYAILVMILTFLTVYIACICTQRWYKLLISMVFSVLVSALVTFYQMGF